MSSEIPSSFVLAHGSLVLTEIYTSSLSISLRLSLRRMFEREDFKSEFFEKEEIKSYIFCLVCNRFFY